jgi:hypothetical protein
MLKSAHALTILLYGLPVWYGLLALAAGVYGIRRRPLPSWFWMGSRVGAVVISLQVVFGILLFVGGSRPGRALHLLYGLLALIVALSLAGLREGGWVRRLVAMDPVSPSASTAALLALTQALLLLRAWMTAVVRGV